MADHGLIVVSSLNNETKLYRYISLSQFISFVESKHTYLSMIKGWADTWELPTSKLPLLDDNGELKFPLWSISDEMFGQAWSLLGESDALWRIYSSQEEGLMIRTTVEKFLKIKDIKRGMLAPVIYYRDLQAGIEKLSTMTDYVEPFAEAFLKREAFEHEKEVRLVTMNDERCLGVRLEKPSHIHIKLDPFVFIDNITIDPRADGWYVDTLQRYCKRAGFEIEPKKSALYSCDVFNSTRLARKYIPVDREED